MTRPTPCLLDPDTDDLCRNLASSIDSALTPLRQTLEDLRNGIDVDRDDTREHLCLAYRA